MGPNRQCQQRICAQQTCMGCAVIQVSAKCLLSMPYACCCLAVAGTVGATIVFPGLIALNFGHFHSVGHIDGLAAVFLMWVLAPPATVMITSMGFLMMRGSVFRGEDCFHQMLWVMLMQHTPQQSHAKHFSPSQRLMLARNAHV